MIELSHLTSTLYRGSVFLKTGKKSNIHLLSISETLCTVYDMNLGSSFGVRKLNWLVGQSLLFIVCMLKKIMFVIQ